jgi:predicted permease
MLDERQAWWLSIMVRLKAGQTAADATAALRHLQPLIRDASLPPESAADARRGFLKEPFVVSPAATGNSSLRDRYQRPLGAIMVVVALVLLIACANVANLLLARANARRHEMSVRAALGASRWRIARQLLVESLLLASVGAALGVIAAQWGTRLLVQQLSTRTSTVFLALSPDWRVFAFTAAVTITTALLFGVVPAFRTARVQPMEAIRELGRGNIGSRRMTMAGALVAMQVALSIVLVVAAALFVRTFANLATRPVGFDRDGVLLATITTHQNEQPLEQRLQAVERMVDAVNGVAGVKVAAASQLTPIGAMNWNGAFRVVGAPPVSGRRRLAFRNTITPGWFATYGTAIVGGRDFNRSDRAGSPRVAIVNQAFARQFLDGANPVGRIVELEDGREPALAIVGVVEDAVYRSLRADAPATLYTAMAQTVADAFNPFAQVVISVRSASGPPALLTRSVAAAIGSANPDAVLTFRTLADQVNASLTQERVVAMLAGFFGALALLLAAIGLYGVTAYAVSQRRAEIGIRMALGAAPGVVVRLVLGRMTMLVAVGIVAGATISMWASMFVATLLYGLEPRDPMTLAGAAVVLAAIGIVAAWLPARRASRIDPAEILREA